ncbi:TPA: hypothetical protein ACH3X3_012647 [Trebouxia sp. C0006]
MKRFEVIQLSRLHSATFKLQHRGAQELRFETADCTGFRWLGRIIHGTLADLGYVSPQIPCCLRIGIYVGKTGERLEIAVGRDIEIEAAAVTVTAEENNEQPAIDSDTSSNIDSDHNTN